MNNNEYTSKQRVILKQDPNRIYYITAVLELSSPSDRSNPEYAYEMVSEDDDKIGRIQWGSDIEGTLREPQVGDVYSKPYYRDKEVYYFVRGVDGDEVDVWSSIVRETRRIPVSKLLKDAVLMP